MTSNEKRLFCEFRALIENGYAPSIAKQQLNIYQSKVKNKLSQDFYLAVDELCETNRIQKHLGTFTNAALPR